MTNKNIATGFNALRVRTRMQIFAALTLLGVVILCLYSVMHLRDSMLEDRKQKTKNLVEVGAGVLTHFSKLAAEGKLPEAEAKSFAKETLRGLRYGSNDYYFVVDAEHRYLL